jgi:hypothetical protein
MVDRNDSFEHAAANARADCPKCHGTGEYMYDHNHGTICNECCRHDRGWWLLTQGYSGWREGRETWCCVAGCGTKRDANPDGVS